MVASRMHLPNRFAGTLLLMAVAGAGGVEAQPLLPSGPEIPVSLSGGIQGNFSVAVFPDGGFVAAWTACAQVKTSSQCVIRARLLASDGAPRSTEINLLHPADLQLDDLAPTADGGFWMVWEQHSRHGLRSDVLAQRYDHQAKPLTAAFVVHDHSDHSSFNRYGARLAVAADGGAVIAWIAQRRITTHMDVDNIVVHFFAPDGTPRSPELNLGSGDGFFNFPAGIGVEPDGSAWILKEEIAGFGHLFLQHLAADGTAGPRFAICTGSVVCSPGQSIPFVNQGTLGMRPDGTFVVLWTYNITETGAPPSSSVPIGSGFESVIQGRLFAADGSPLGDAFQVNRFLTSEALPSVTVLQDGRFVALWVHLDDALNPAAVYGRSFATDGTPTSGDFRFMDVPGLLAAGGGNVVGVFQLPDGRLVAQRFTTP
jgi:hypothetical protein